MEDINVQNIFSINKVSDNDIERPASKRPKLFCGPCETVEERIDKNLSSAISTDLLKHTNEFAQKERCHIESDTEIKAVDEKNNVINSSIELERQTDNKNGFGNYPTKCGDHSLGITDFIAPLQMKTNIEKRKHTSSDDVLIPDVADNEGPKTDMLLLGYKVDISDDETLNSTKMKHEQVLHKIVMACESVKSEENEADEMCIKSVNLDGTQGERGRIIYKKHEGIESKQEPGFNSVSIACTKNPSVGHIVSVLGASLERKNSEIQKGTGIFNQAHIPVRDSGSGTQPVDIVQSSCPVNCSTSNTTVNETAAQKIVIVPLKCACPENSSRLFIEMISEINKNDKTAPVNMHYHGDRDGAINVESTRIQFHNNEVTCVTADELQETDIPVHINKFIETNRIINVKCGNVDVFKELTESKCEDISKNPDRNDQFLNKKSAEEVALIVQLQLSDKKQAELMQRLPEISNSKHRYSYETNSSSQNEDLGHSLKERKSEMLEAMSLTKEKYLEKNSGLVGDTIQDLCSHSYVETDNFSAGPIVNFISQDAIHSSSHECRSRCLPINSIEAFDKKLEIISANERSENLTVYCVDSDKNGISHNEDSNVTDIPASTFSGKNSAMDGSGVTKVISEITDRQQSDSNVAQPPENDIRIEREADNQLKYLSNPHFVKDEDADFHTERADHCWGTDNRMWSDCTNKLGQFSTSSGSVNESLQWKTNTSALLLGQKPDIFGEHHSSRGKCNTENKTKDEIKLLVPENASVQRPVAYNLIKNSEVNNFSLQEAKYQLNYVAGPNYLKGADSEIHSATANVLQTTLCLQSDKGQSSKTACGSKVCSFTDDNLLSCTASIAMCEQQSSTNTVLKSENETEETIVSSENINKKTSLESVKKTEVNISRREGPCQQKYASRSSCVKYTSSNDHKELSIYGISHFDTDNAHDSQSEWSDQLTQFSIFGAEKHSVLSLPQTAAHFSQRKEALNEHNCNKIFNVSVRKENSIDNENTTGISENGSVQTSGACDVSQDAEVNTSSENKAKYHFKCLINSEWLKSTRKIVGTVPVTMLHPVPSLEDDGEKESAIRHMTETIQFSSVCNLIKDNTSLMCTANILIYHQNKLLDEHNISPTVMFSAKNSSEETEIVFTGNLDRQKTTLLSYTKTGRSHISKREMGHLQKYTSGCDYIRNSDNDPYVKINMLHVFPHYDTEHTHIFHSDYSYRLAQSSFNNSNKDAVTFHSPVNTSLFSHDNEILKEREGRPVLNAEGNVEENRTRASTYANIQKFIKSEMIEDGTISDLSENCDEPVNDPSCFINGRNDVPIHLVNVFHETHQSEASNRHMAQIKCTDKTVHYSNICNSLKDCSGLNSTINSSTHCELKEVQAGCSSNKPAAVTFNTDTTVKEKVVLKIESSKEAVTAGKEGKSKQPEITIKTFCETTSSDGSAFDNFEKITLDTDIEEVETITLTDFNCSDKEMYNKNGNLTKQLIYYNDNNKLNKILLPQLSSFTSSLVKDHQSDMNNSDESKSVIAIEKYEKEYSYLRLPDILQNKEENSLCYVQTSQPLVDCKMAPTADQLKQVDTESTVWEIMGENKQLSCDIGNAIQNDMASLYDTHKEESMLPLDTFFCANPGLLEMDHKGQKQKGSEKANTLARLSVDPLLTNGFLAVYKHKKKEDKKPLVLKITHSEQQFEQDNSITVTQGHLPCPIKSMNSYMKESNDNEISTCLISSVSLDHKKQNCGKTIPLGTNDYFEQINSNTGSVMLNIEVRQPKKQFIHLKNDISNFEMKEQFNAVLEELCLFHEISRESDVPDGVTGENKIEITNDTKRLDELPDGLDQINNISMCPMHNNLQHVVFPHEKTALSHKDHDYLIGEDVSHYASPVFAKRVSFNKGEQEVPMEVDESETEREESMYTPQRISG
ncbi:hypothetical protein chiPu_0006606 [Chiloscyllium punctatum]|uniref:Uncharacterized protein n=1 Tax=Chiloscyllium punctatum TaxID=137246 RepID=A0A401SCQ5_CHIPU|nr:hypothetical protein [Chiloscyllium punctatum]